MIDQFTELIKLSNECCNFSELITSMTEVDALREGVVKFNALKISLSENQQKILIKDNLNAIIQYIIDKSTGSLSVFGRDLIESTISINPDYLLLFEYLSKFDDSNPPKKFNEILAERMDPLSYFLFTQELFDTFSIPIDANEHFDALSDVIRYVLLHTKKLALAENISKLNIEVLKITKKVHGSKLSLFKCIFQNCFEKSIIHKNRISKETFNSSLKRLFEVSKSSKQLISNEKENTLIDMISDFVYYACYLKHDTNRTFYPYGQIKSEIIEEAKTKTVTLIENLGKILTKGSFANGCYILKIKVKWEKKFKGARLSNASFLKIKYKNIKKIYEINHKKSGADNCDKKKEKNKRKSSNGISVHSENSFVEIILPSFSKVDEKVEISLIYVKEKFSDVQREKVPPEGFGTLSSFTFSLNQNESSESNETNETKQKTKTKSKNKKTSDSNQGSNNDFESNNEDGKQPFIVEFKRKEKALSTKCGSISITSKYYDLQNDNIPDLFQNNPYISKSDNNSYSDNFQVQIFLDFFIENLVNEWINGKIYRTTTTGTTSILMSIYPPQEFYIGLIEFSTRYSIPASTIYLRISKSLLKAWCHSESYLNAFAAIFLSAYVSLMNNKKRVNTEFLNEEEEEMYQFIIDFLQKNVPMFMIQHLSKPALYQKHALLPLFMLLSFVIPEEKIDSYVDQLIEESHRNIIKSVTGYLKPTKLENDQKTGKIIPEVEELMKYVNSSNNSSNDINDNSSENDSENMDLTDVTFSIDALAETMDMLNKRTKQLNKFYEDSSLPNFINQWETIRGEFCKFALLLVKMFFTIQNRNDCADSSVFKFMFAYREIYLFFGEDEDEEEEKIESNKDLNLELKYNKNDFPEINDDELDDKNNEIVIISKRSEFKKISKNYSPFKLFFDVVLNWISRIGDEMINRTTKAVEYDTLEIENRKMSTSPGDIFVIFRQSFDFLKSLHWDDPSIETFIETFLGLCGSCLRNYADLLTMKMLSYFPTEVIREAKIHEIWRFIDDLEKSKDKMKNEQITPRKIFVIINNFFNLKSQWNDFLIYAKSIFPSFFPEDKTIQKNNDIETDKNIPLSSQNSSSVYSIILPPQIVDPLPKLTPISNSIPNLFSRLTSHEVTKTVSPHLWVKNSVMKQVFVKKASALILNPEFFKTMSPIYASIYDKIVNYIKEKIDDINATVCVKYYKRMIVSFLLGLDSGMMNLLAMHSENDEPIKHKRLGPIIDFIQAVYKEIFQYIIDNSTEKIFDDNEKIENCTPFSHFMFEHVSDDALKLIEYVKQNSTTTVIYCGNENDHEFLIDLCAFIIVSSHTNDKRQEVVKWVNDYKSRFAGKHFYPPKQK